MKKTIIKIIIQIALIIAILIIPIVKVILENQSGNTIENREIVFDVNQYRVEVEDTFDLHFSAKNTHINLKSLIQATYKSKITGLEIDGKEKVPTLNYTLNNNSNKEVTNHIKVNYGLEESNIKKYTDLTCLTINLYNSHIDYMKNIDVQFHFEKPTQIFEVENGDHFGKIIPEKISDTEYIFHIDKANVMKNTNINVLFDSTVTDRGILKNQNYKKQTEMDKQEFIEKSTYIPILFFSIVFMVVSYMIYFIFVDKKQKISNMRREWEDLIPPALAETIVDGKVGAKELIMTVITDLITRGNIEVINNEAIVLKNRQNLSEYEQKIVGIIFEEGKQIYFSQFKDIFVKINSKTKEIYQAIEEIKDGIIEELTYKGLLSKKKKTIINIIRKCMIMNIVVILLTISGLIFSVQTIFPFLIIMVIIMFIFKSKKKTFFEKMDEINHSRSSTKLKMMIVTFCIIIIIGMVWYINMVPVGNSIFMIIMILEIIFIIKTKKQFLTSKGREEKRRILELKKYLEEYSIMEERDLQDIIIWDKYLAYATAFGIPNKITKKIYEDYMNMNITLQKIEKIIKII